jgi:translation initiation factor IF-3
LTGRHRALLSRALLADGVVFRPLNPDGPGDSRDQNTTSPVTIRPEVGNPLLAGRSRAIEPRPATMRGEQRPEEKSGHRTRGGPISTETRVNERIRVPEVRLIGPGGEQVGIVRIEDALRVAADADLDLVEVAPNARPPVCKIMDYGKFKYEAAQKARESRKNQQQTVVKEQKLRPKIDDHDYETKKGHVIRFLEAGSKVKVTIMFRGREQSRPELGYRLLQRLGADVADYGFVETSAKQDGRNMTMVLAPHRGAKTRARAAEQATGGAAQAAHSAHNGGTEPSPN